jgi:hypothetical protein
VTDDLNTKQWFALYNVEQFYHQIHSQAVSLKPELDVYLPLDLRPSNSNSIFSSQTISFKNEIDEKINRSIEDYLYKVFYTIGKQLFIEIVFNEQLDEKSDDTSCLSESLYFESFSEFNAKGVDLNVDKVKKNLEKCVNDSKLTSTLSILKKNYNYQDSLLKSYFENLDEIYNAKLNPLNFKRENLKLVIMESKAKIDDSKKQYGEKIVEKAKLTLEKATKDFDHLSNQIDQIYFDYKVKFIKIYEFIIQAIKLDIERINNIQFTSFAKLRLNELVGFLMLFLFRLFFQLICIFLFSLQEELSKKKIQKYELEFKIVEKKVNQNKNIKTLKNSNHESIKIDEIKLEMLKIQINIITEKENQLKMKLEKNKNIINLNAILIEDEQDKEDSLEENFEDANDNEEEFYQSSIASSNISCISNFSINPIKVSGLVQQDSIEVKNIKKYLLDLSREKSSTRNKLVS